MESLIVSVLGNLAQHGVIADTTLLVIIISLLGLCFKFILKPIYDKIKNIPTVDEIKILVDGDFKAQGIDINVLNEKLNKVVDVLSDIEDLCSDNYKDIQDLRRDLESVKQILNQFQGHLMYSGKGDFGNRELH